MNEDAVFWDLRGKGVSGVGGRPQEPSSISTLGIGHSQDQDCPATEQAAMEGREWSSLFLEVWKQRSERKGLILTLLAAGSG
jgi:hypothetical protein